MTALAWPPVFRSAELAELLSAPDAGEIFSPIDGPGCLVLDLGQAASLSRRGSNRQRGELADLSQVKCDRLESLLPTLPCVTVALHPDSTNRDHARETDESSRLASQLASVCDVCVADEAQLERLVSGFAENPLAALAFVQLLRNESCPSVYQGLVAESFAYSALQSGPEFERWQASRSPGTSRRRHRGRGESPAACRIERDRARLDIWLSRPEKHNAFSRGMRDSLSEALHLALFDPSIEEIVLKGEGSSFCSGGDLDEFGSLSDPMQAHAIRLTRSPALLMSRLAGRIRCEVHGACMGAGIELPAFTDRVTADQDAFFGLPEISLGLVPGAGGTVSLPRRMGRQRTAWLGLSGERIDVQTALEWGLVDEVCLRQHPDS